MLARERAMFDRSFAALPWSAWACEGVARRSPDARIIRHDPGLDLELFRPADEREPRPRPRVLCVAARFTAKGGDDLLAALGPLLGELVDLDIVTTGEVAERPGVRVHRLGPGDPQLVHLQQQADIFCLPTQEDASPFALREAMACGAAVVSTPIGAIAEILDEGRAGVLVEPGDIAGLREAVQDARRGRCAARAAGPRRPGAGRALLGSPSVERRAAEHPARGRELPGSGGLSASGELRGGVEHAAQPLVQAVLGDDALASRGAEPRAAVRVAATGPGSPPAAPRDPAAARGRR